jgi:hypothetical protein
MQRWHEFLSIVGLLAFISACSKDDGPTSHLEGPIGVVTSPNGAEGAAIVEFAGVVDSVMIEGGTAFLRSAGGITRAALILDQPGTIRFSLPKVSSGSLPATSVIQVADGNNQLRSNTSAYQVTYAR